MAAIKELRAATNAPLKDCKQALDEAGGDVGKAQEWLVGRGKAIAAKKVGRTANEGLVGFEAAGATAGVLVEVRCETDFAAKNAAFHEFVADVVARVAAEPGAAAGDGLFDAAAAVAGPEIDDAAARLALRIGERCVIGRGAAIAGDVVGGYVHRGATGGAVGTTTLGHHGALVALSGDPTPDAALLAGQLAQHIVGMQPATKDELLDQPLLFDPDSTVRASLAGRDIRYHVLRIGDNADE